MGFLKGEGLNQTKIAEQIGVTKQSIINYKKGVNFPTGKRLNRIIEVLGISPEQLLGERALQSHYEAKMHHVVNQRVDFLLGYEIQLRENPEQVRSYLLDQLSALSDSELFSCLFDFHDQKTKDAVHEYASDIVNDTLYPPQTVEFKEDIVLKHVSV